MKIPIPDDWQVGDEYVCVQIQWPNSPLWIAILTGFLSLPSYGYFWDERSGRITDVQRIGRDIFNANFPYSPCVDCEDNQEPTTPDSDGMQTFLSSALGIGEDCMTLCGINPKALRWNSAGELEVRDFCGEWVSIGAPPGTDNAIDDVVTDDYKPDGYVDSTPCSIAWKLAEFTHSIVSAAMLEIGGASEMLDIIDFCSDMRDKFPGVDLAWNELINMFVAADVINGATLQNEAIHPDLIRYMACAWSPLIAPTNNGIDSATYKKCCDATQGAIREKYPKGIFYGFESMIWQIYELAIVSLGAGDAKKITQYAQPRDGQDCTCPIEEEFPTEPNEYGWYFSAPIASETFNVPYDPEGEFPYSDWGWAYARAIAEHDIYGFRCTLTKMSGSVGTVKRANDPIAYMGSYDHFLSYTNSENTGLGKFAQMNELEFIALGLDTDGYTRLAPLGDDGYTSYADPPVLKGLVALMAFSLGQSGDDTGTVQMSDFRWLHNTNSPSHQ